ncbi:TatD family hydrolase [bacterium]|nr:TatD family hydrolase [bacterium]
MKNFFTDTHAHIAMLLQDEDSELTAESLIEKLTEAEVKRIISISGHSDELLFSHSQIELFSHAGIELLCSAGIHPHEAEAEGENIQWLYDNADKIIAVGESGLDFHYDFSPREIQRKVFRKMIEISIELEKPLIIHARSAESEAIDILLNQGMRNKRVLFHCYTGDLKTAEAIISHGWYISISGIATFKKGDDIREILRMIPEDKLLLETDSPYLAPAPFRGKINTPALIPHLYIKAAEERQCDVKTLTEIITANTNRFFNL